MKLADLTLADLPEPIEDPPLDARPPSAKRKGWRSYTYPKRTARIEEEKQAAMPDWMLDRSKLPMKPPGRMT